MRKFAPDTFDQYRRGAVNGRPTDDYRALASGQQEGRVLLRRDTAETALLKQPGELISPSDEGGRRLAAQPGRLCGDGHCHQRAARAEV